MQRYAATYLSNLKAIAIKFRWVAFFHLHFWQLFHFIFHFILQVKSSFFHHLSSAVKIISTRVHTKKLWAKLQSLPTILKCTLVWHTKFLIGSIFTKSFHWLDISKNYTRFYGLNFDSFRGTNHTVSCYYYHYYYYF